MFSFATFDLDNLIYYNFANNSVIGTKLGSVMLYSIAWLILIELKEQET